MENRLYFIFGDLFANVLVATVTVALTAWFIGGTWGMSPGMVVGMVIGMAMKACKLMQIFCFWHWAPGHRHQCQGCRL